MRKFLLALSLLVGAATSANLVFAGDWENFPNGREPLYHGSHGSIQKYSSTLGSSFGYGDSTYIGYTPGFVGKDYLGAPSANNPWGITASTTTAGTNNVHRPPRPGRMWQWDNSSAFGETGANGFPNGDSLQGR